MGPERAIRFILVFIHVIICKKDNSNCYEEIHLIRAFKVKCTSMKIRKYIEKIKNMYFMAKFIWGNIKAF